MMPSIQTRIKDRLNSASEWLRRSFATLTWPQWPARIHPALWIATALCAVLTVAVLWLYFLDWNTMRGPLARYASQRLGREVRIDGPLEVHLFSFTPRASISGLKLSNPSWVGPPLAADVARVSVSVRLLPLLIGNLVVPNVELDHPNIQIVRDRDGRTNWDFGHGNAGWGLPPIHRFVVRDGHLEIDDHLRKMMFTGTVSSQEQDGSGQKAFQMTGQGTLNKNSFLAEIHGGPLINVDASKPYQFSADIHSGATHIVGSGAFRQPFHLGRFWATATFMGANLSDLYNLTGVAFPGTPPYHLSGTLSRNGSLYKFSNFSGVVGQTDLRGNLSVETAPDPSFVSAVLASHQLRFSDLGALFGTGSAGSAGQTAPVGQPAYLLPDTPLHVERVRETDADVQYDADTVKSRDFPLRGLHVHVVADKGVLTLNPVAFEFTRGRLAGSLKIDARNEIPVTDMDARFTGLRLEQFVSGNPPPVEGTMEARIVVHGAGNSVHKAASTANGAVTLVVPGGKLRKLFAELTGINVLSGLGLLLTNDKSDTGVRCAVAHFDARDGILRAQPLIIDTDSVLIFGGGTIDLGHETLDMSVRGKQKEFRFVRLRAPITLKGPLADPAIGVNVKSALTQGGGALALGAFINPLAALLAFVDPGLAKDANCAALNAQAEHGTAPVKKSAVRRASRAPRGR